MSTRRARRGHAAKVARVMTAGSVAALGTVTSMGVGARPAGAATIDGLIWVIYDSANPRNSTMHLLDGFTQEDAFRTGSGNGTANTCNKYTGDGDPDGGGPAPVGTYDMGTSPSGHQETYTSLKIWGRVWHMKDKNCPNGTPRTELFIHSEQTQTNTQHPTYEPQRWDGPTDYTSQGCWKVARSENGGDNGVARLDGWWHNSKGAAATTNVAYTGVLVVSWP